MTRSYGSLQVSALTKGSLYLDGKAMGELPEGAEARLEGIEAGKHEIELRYASGERESKSVAVQKDQGVDVGFTWKKPSPRAVDETTPGDLVRAPAGRFIMGSPISETNRGSEEVQHDVKMSAFFIGRYEVTQGEWQAVMGTNPSYFSGDERLPVERVSWYDCVVYCNKRSIMEGFSPCYSMASSADPDTWGDVPTSHNSIWDEVRCDFSAKGYRLPTEAEWEYACRAGTRAASSAGGTLVSAQANFNGSKAYNSATKGTYLEKTVPVGSYLANGWGIYDMHGNVAEWCWDIYNQKYYSHSTKQDPLGEKAGRYRVLRGGSWYSSGYDLRSANRSSGDPNDRRNLNGLRIVRRER